MRATLVIAPSLLLTAALLLACPTRRNPALPEDSGAVDDGDEALADADQGPTDALVDGDTLYCPPAQQLCGDQCFSMSDLNHCGDCDTRCDPDVSSCRCTQMEGAHDYDCWRAQGPSTTWETCTLEL